MVSLPIHLPPGCTPVVAVGEPVSVGQLLAEHTAKEEEIVNIPQELNVSLKQAKKILKKIPGDIVHEGDVIAVKKKFFGFEEEDLISKVNGKVSRYERDTGNLAITTSYTSLTKKITSPVAGTVTLCDNERIVISTDKNIIAATKAVGGRNEGEVFILETAQATEDIQVGQTLYHLDRRAIGKMVVGGKLSREVLMKGVGIGALGIIGTHIADADLEYMNKRGVKVPVVEIPSEMLETLQQWQNKRVYVDSESKTILFLSL